MNQLTSERRVTIKDVAVRAGIGHPSVSAVLNGAKGQRVSQATRERILEAAQELGYRPNLVARSMKSGKSHQIGVLVQNNPQTRHAHPLAYEFLLGINEGLDDAGYMMSLIRLADVAGDGDLGAKALEGHLVDGIIVVNQIPQAAIARLEQMAPPCVWLDSNIWREERCVRRDEVGVGALAVQELVKLGYREIIYGQSGQGNQHYSFEQRQRGACEAAHQLGVPLREVLLDRTSLKASFRALFPQLAPDVGLILSDIYTARFFAYFLTEQAIRPGVDFGLACCDDDLQVPQQIWNTLARVSFDRFEMGRRAAQMMLQVLPDLDAAQPSQLVRGEWIAGNTAPQVP